MRGRAKLLITFIRNIRVHFVHIMSEPSSVNVGDIVTPDMCIGKMGATGMATGSHLHFEFRDIHGGTVVKKDPRDTYVLVGIYDTEGNLLFMDDEKYYKRFHLIVEWQEDDDILWVYSGDIGVYCIFAKNNEWQKLSDKSEQIVGKPPRRIAKQLASLGLD